MRMFGGLSSALMGMSAALFVAGCLLTPSKVFAQGGGSPPCPVTGCAGTCPAAAPPCSTKTCADVTNGSCTDANGVPCTCGVDPGNLAVCKCG